LSRKKDKHFTIKPKDVPEIDFRVIIDTLAKQLKLKRSGALVSLLRNTSFDGRLFRFVYFEDDSWKVYVLCPKCKERKLKLFKLEDEYACDSCHHLSRPYRRKNPKISAVYARYIRPIKLLNEIEAKLLDPEAKLSERQRQILENKAAKIRKSMPEYAELLRQEIVEKLSK
jgi:hypothetical protein